MLDKKTISITGKRQITIPQELYDSLGFEKEVKCVLHNGELVVRPVDQEEEMFSEQILADLIAQGYSGEELLTVFKQAKAQILPAVEAMLKEAESAAAQPEKYASYGDIFSEDGGE